MKKKAKGGNAAGGAGVRCTAGGCKSGWVEFEVTRQIDVRDKLGNVVDTRDQVGVTNEKCGVCDGTGWR